MPRRGPTIIRDCRHQTVTHQHGTAVMYVNDHCRCDPCRKAHNAKMGHRRRMVAYGRWGDNAIIPAVGSRRRIEALMTLGWSLPRLAEQLGISHSVLWHKLGQSKITPPVAKRIAELYDRLWDQRPTPANGAEACGITKTVNRAKRLRYAPPLAWDDDTIDDPDTQPQHRVTAPSHQHVDEIAVAERRPTTRAEVDLVVDELTRSGLSHRQIAVMIDAAERTVLRARANARRAAEEQQHSDAA